MYKIYVRIRVSIYICMYAYMFVFEAANNQNMEISGERFITDKV